MDKEDNAGFDELNDSFEVDRESRELVFGAGMAYRCRGLQLLGPLHATGY